MTTFAQALEELKTEFRRAFEPPILALLQLLDRQLRRSPRLYRRLGGEQ